MVMRTYTTGISLSHIPRKERGIHRKKLASIVNQLSDENTKLNVNKIRQAINYLMFDELKDIKVCDTLNLKEVRDGKFGVNGLMTDFNNSPNYLHSGYHQLLTTSKGYLDRVSKVQQIIQFMYDNKLEFVKWILWGRSVYANQTFAKKWQVKFSYVDRLMAGVHNRYFKDGLPCFTPNINTREFKSELSKFIETFTADTENKNKFLHRLKILDKQELDLIFIPFGWKNLKIWLDANGYPRSYLSSFTQILSQVYLKHYMSMINTIYTAKIEELLTIPFSNDKKHKLPYLMVSGPKYVVRRMNNDAAWKSMQADGFFELKFKYLEDKWDNSIEVKVIASRKIRLLGNVKLKSMIVMPPKNGDVDIHLIFSGNIEEFIATKHLDTKLDVEKSDRIAIDINRRGKYAIVSNLDIELPDYINQLSKNWDRALSNKSYFQQLLEKTDHKWKKIRYAQVIDNLHQKIQQIRKTYHLKLANFLGQLILSAGAKYLILEDLNVNTINTKGALARAITSMADDTSLYIREVLALRIIGVKVKLHFVNPYQTSSKHHNCGGKIKRTAENYDIALCGLCGEMVNTHKNAANNLASSTIRG